MSDKPEAPEPADPLTGLIEGFIAMNELFKKYVEGGFTEDQALRLIALMGWAAQQNKMDET